MRVRLSDEEFVATWGRLGSASQMARETGISERAIHLRRQTLAGRGVHLPTRAAAGYENHVPAAFRPDDAWTWAREKRLPMHDGTVVVFSDAHYWPGEATTAHKALLTVIRKVRPRAVIANGDVMDGASTGRHPPFGWAARPTPVQELEVCQERLHEIELAIPRGCELLWNIGNHCLRFERTLAMSARDFAGLPGLRLADHFPLWQFQWSTLVNPDERAPVMVKHRHAGGIHAGYNNAMKSGVSIVTGHTHLLEVKPWGDYRGRRYGIQSGTLADLEGPAFEYHENGPSPACSGFVVLTFRDGSLIPPELCEVIDGKAWFRGEVVQ